MPNGPNLIVLTINGERKEVRVWPTETLADTLRERLGLTGTRIMCNEESVAPVPSSLMENRCSHVLH